MIETNYNYESGYHEGSFVEQDALAYLGVYKRIEDVSDLYYLGNFETDVDADAAWEDFCDKKLANSTTHTRETVYGGAYRRWCEYCDRHGIHPALADPANIEKWLAHEIEAHNSTMKAAHDLQFRPIFRWYRWMAWNSDWPHRYQPTIMAVLLGGVTYDIWQTRLFDRKNIPTNDD
ncbi:hypothetical protein [Halorubrum sp. Eb13]|uniref:hypothetical protein n=1 Tax=Halorubrum sp. Eb13 TaxID=1383843 RepID=UPI000B98EF70|nr:hypothetical protein [Halorubrum sp. Eb13]OYR42895.1 hypothetical protein DJ75_12420 [Halorubrum sp. Eb13]